MPTRRLLVAVVLSCLVLPGAALAAAKAAKPPTQFGFFTAAADGTIETFDLASILVPADRVCNGGSCVVSGTQTINCPTSGGPTCTGTQICTCRCSNDDPPAAYNDCVDRPDDDGDGVPDDDTPIEIDP